MISHLIFLTREQRYALINGENVTVIGVSIPVWTQSNEPLDKVTEVFCRYILQNSPGGNRIHIAPGGYAINLPQRVETEYDPLSNEEWRAMTVVEQEAWYDTHKLPPSAGNLKDIRDNGSEYLKFHYVSLSKNLKTIHNIEIKTIESLISSF